MKCTMDNHGILIHRLFCHSEHSEESPDHLKRVIKLRDPSAPASPTLRMTGVILYETR